MAWWDHEELKAPYLRSDRYIVTFPDDYSQEEVDAASKRIHEERLKSRTSKNPDMSERELKDL